MFSFFLFFWLLLLFIFLYSSSNLLLSLLVLEILSFFILFGMVLFIGISSLEFFFVSLFCIFVIESVIALSGLIMLVSFTGSDYVSSSAFLKC